MLCPHFQSYNEQNPEPVHELETSNTIQIDLCASYDRSEVDDKVFDDDFFCINDDDWSNMFANGMNISVILDDNHYHFSWSKSVSETGRYKSRSSNV